MPASILAFASSLHLGLTLLRYHRSASHRMGIPLVLVSSVFVAIPWVLASAQDVLVGLAAHLTWFATAEPIDRWLRAAPVVARVAPVAATSAPARAPAPGRAAQPPAPPRQAPRPSGFVALPVIGVVEETPDIKTIRVTRPEGFAFAAGQFLTVRIRIDQRDHVRCYSISSSPQTAGYLEISVKRQGLVSSALHATMRAGGVLHARRPAGTFVYPEGDDRALVLVAGGVGITPMISMLRHGLATEPQRPFTLLHGARDIAGLAFADELRVLARRWPSLQWVPAVSGAGAPPFCYPGRIDAHLITTTVPNIADALVYMCGPSSMLDTVRQTLLSLGVADAQIRFERFEAAIAAVGAHATAAVVNEADDTGPPAKGNVITFARSCQTHTAGKRDTLLDAAEACGVAIPSLCRAGVCGTCRTRVKEGTVRCDTSALGEDERADGYVLACVAHADSHCTVEA